jgi:hypothetical protein
MGTFVCRLLLLAMVSLPMAGPVAAIPVTYTINATLEAIGADILGLDGAALTIVAEGDTSDAPASIQTYTDVASAYYTVTRTLTVSNRPGGLPDETVPYPEVYGVGVINVFPASLYSDRMSIGSAEATVSGSVIRMPGFSWDFGTTTYFPGTSPPALPVVDPSDVVSRSVSHPILTPDYQTQLYLVHVPEPGMLALLAAGALAIRRAGR